MRPIALLSVLALAGCLGDLDAGVAGPRGSGRRPPPVDCESGGAIAPASRVPRLTFEQYDRAVSDLVGLRVSPSAELGGDPGDVFTRQLVDGLEAAARDVSAQVAADDAALARLAPCAATAPADEAACAAEVIATVGRRAYRRPLTPDESARYLALFTDRAMLTATGSFREGIALLIEAFLQSPGFLLRVERSTEVRDGRIPLSPFEIAQRLSFALWGSIPDDALLDAARDGALGTREQVLAQASRMLADPRARELVRTEHRHWLGMDGSYAHFWTNVRRDAPEFAGITDADLQDDVLRSLELVSLDEDGGLRAMLTSPRAVVNDRTAALYGLSGSYPDWTPVDLDEAERPGLLTRVGFLASHARSTRPSLIYRGAFVLRRVLCEPIGNPPAGAESTPLPDTAGLVTRRERIDAMTAGGACAGCHHTRINPAGYALERFDELGRRRDLDNGAAIDTTGTLSVGRDELVYEDARTYAGALAETDEARACYARRWVEFTFDRAVRHEDGCTIDDLALRLSDDGYSVRDLLADLVQTDAFLHRSTVEAE